MAAFVLAPPSQPSYYSDMLTVQRVVEVEAFGGPFDGSTLPVYALECVVKVLADSPFRYRYRLIVEDDGTKFWLFAGIIEGAMA